MIFTREQWQEIYDRYHCDSPELTTRPNDMILAILEHDAVEYGIHPTWVQWWNNPEAIDSRQRWANALYVMLYYKRETLPSWWAKPCNQRI